MVKRPNTVPKMRGVEALLSQNSKLQDDKLTTSLPLSSIRVSKSQPRRYFDPEKLEQLIQSVQEHGILEPLLVRPLTGDKYELIAGERRFRAAKALNLDEVPVSIKHVSKEQAAHIALVENLQRDDLNPVEETEGILKLLSIVLAVPESEVCSILHQAYNAKQRNIELNGNVTIQLEIVEKVLSEVGRFNAESFRSNRLPLLNLPKDILESLRQGEIQYTKARIIARVKDPEVRIKLLEESIEKNLSLMAIKEKIQKLKKSTKDKKSRQEEKFSNRLQEVSKKLRSAEIWKDSNKRMQAEKLLSELESLMDS